MAWKPIRLFMRYCFNIYVRFYLCFIAARSSILSIVFLHAVLYAAFQMGRKNMNAFLQAYRRVMVWTSNVR